MLIQTFIVPIIFLFAASIMQAAKSSIYALGSNQSRSEFSNYPRYYFAYMFIQRAFPKERWTGLFAYLNLTAQILRLCFAISAVVFLLSLEMSSFGYFIEQETLHIRAFWIALAIVIIIFVALVFDFLAKYLGSQLPVASLKLFTPVVSICIVVLSPINLVLLKVLKKLTTKPEHPIPKSYKIKHKLQELLVDSDLMNLLDTSDKRLLFSIASFRDRTAKEIMVPRINVFSLAYEEKLSGVIESCFKEGYSRIPIYKDTVDNIVGVLLYKDVLQHVTTHLKSSQSNCLDISVGKLAKPALYAPESKKIAKLLQEFRESQTHIAIIVDEYGGTEGIVTIEDILEELVGEIADEYDVDEKALYQTLDNGSWIVDAKMNILDIEKELNIKIPTAPEYDTVGGYIFHEAGSIPEKGWCIHLEEFDLEVISSNERSLEKIRITPIKTLPPNE